MEAELLNTAEHTADLDVGILCANRRSNDCVNLIFRIVFRFLQNTNRIDNIRFIGNRAERTLIHARAAGNAFFLVDTRLSGFIIDRERLRFARANTRTRLLDDRRIRARFDAAPAFDALGFIDRCAMIHNRNRVLGARILAAMRDAAAARGRDHNALDRAFVARNRQYLDHIFILAIAAERQLYALIDDCALLVNAAAHRRLRSRGNQLRDIGNLLKKVPIKRRPRDLPQYSIL